MISWQDVTPEVCARGLDAESSEHTMAAHATNRCRPGRRRPGRRCITALRKGARLLEAPLGAGARARVRVEAHAPTPGSDGPPAPGRTLGRTPKYDVGRRARTNAARAPELADGHVAPARDGALAAPRTRPSGPPARGVEPDGPRTAPEWPAVRLHRGRHRARPAPRLGRRSARHRASPPGRSHGARRRSGVPQTQLRIIPIPGNLKLPRQNPKLAGAGVP